MRQRIEAKSALGTGGWIAQTISQEGMGEFVDSDGDDQTKNKIERFCHGLSIQEYDRI